MVGDEAGEGGERRARKEEERNKSVLLKQLLALTAGTNRHCARQTHTHTHSNCVIVKNAHIQKNHRTHAYMQKHIPTHTHTHGSASLQTSPPLQSG